MEKKELLDGSKTSFDWQKSPTTLCILPVGSFEQHSRHLPLTSDSIGAQYFGEFVARELGAALLPLLPYGTSNENRGFRGTVSLRPETLMQTVRDIAAEVETQGFTVMIVLNGHGGNFSLGPAIRDINRRDGKLKILLVNYFDFPDAELFDVFKQGKFDIHSGEPETSFLMSLVPELVKPGGVDMHSAYNWKQSDLNTFAMGYFVPDGACGYPSLASREKGDKCILSIKRQIIPYIRERLGWLEQNRTYTGKEWTER